MANDTKSTTGWPGKIINWVGAALIGALMVLLLNASGDKRDVKNLMDRMDKVEQVQSSYQQTYATNKRVDDLTSEIRGNLQQLNSKVDDVLKYLISRK